MPKEFRYRGKTIEELNSMSTEALLELLPSRARRSLNRGVSEDKRKLLEDARATKEGKLQDQIKTHARDMIILPTMVGLTIAVHNGREFVPLEVKPEMIGRYLGEYVITNKKVVHGTPGIGASRSSLYVPLK
ncbi:MAG: 30S ribosomal protein S19 [Nitrososphaerota archaeon]|jgi:small subunit ribosomal protein S19|nr:30S ribosomal protein S19 [Nitrososphaerota archaeon]MDG6903373.1 30S ribosomal protein S19 [Nitrososphaerota archaeon]MDG6911765.1 30S ribosomal protein S19 [Nitrososphaerota archaeon]MDG6940753.1 30S ribosomal protein S19 [Nitrososphaerota archaeon]MDG6945642.1 30S ribosomal protein S19 [Nitrososphaerota archaeon]